MFPYVCLATMPLFCRRYDWPRKLFQRKGGPRLHSPTTTTTTASAEPMMRYADRGDDNNSSKSGKKDLPLVRDNDRVGTMSRRRERRKRAVMTVSKSQRLVVALLMAHVALQLFLPYSHFVTKGYNNWVSGMYGYSWDMMVHAWDVAHVVVRVRDNERGQDHYLDPGVWTLNDRWARHPDMVRQYAHCVKENLEKSPLNNGLSSNISIYVDVWCSLNGRFQQRLFDPRVDLLTVDWHPLRPASYLMPLLEQFTAYRPELDRIERETLAWSKSSDVLFVADYPGLSLEQYLGRELDNVTLRLIEGKIAVEQAEEDEDEEDEEEEEEGGGGGGEVGCKSGGGRELRTIVLDARATTTLSLRTGRYHKVRTLGRHPACYAYTFVNRTMAQKQLAAAAAASSSSLHHQQHQRRRPV
uniref:Vitamin K-dependent gamma-carboxylase lumenal domain-containing protein n=1 Tax=Trichogramma kaykai TaxID=54128 RepID=A0ABD2W199_9HYME